MSLSLRTQVSLWFGLAILTIVFILTFVTEQVTVWNMERAVDDSLQKRAQAVSAIVSLDITTAEQSYARVIGDLADGELPFVPLLLRLVSPAGRVIIQFGKVPDWIVQNLDYQLGFPDVSNGRFDSIRLKGTEPLRVYTILVSDARTGQALALVQTAESLEQVDNARHLLWRNSIIVGLVGSLLAIAAGLVLMWRGFRPLQRIVRTINNVDYNHLSTRLQQEARPVELKQLAISLMAMWQRLDMAASAKQEIIGRMSHDLRTPLTALQGHLEVLLLQPSLSVEVRDSLERMRRETRRLVRMAENLLLNVQLESSPVLVAEEVNLKELLDEVVGDMWVMAEGLEFNVVAPADVVVYGDRDLLKEMALNIVDNAIKFTPRGGQVELTLSGENGWAVLGVSDTGRGIPSDQLPHVTEPFYKADPSRKSAGEGARLGLAIVKQIAKLHGGLIDIQSQEGVGTSVKVRLPTRESLKAFPRE